MIIGVGADLCDLERIAGVLDRQQDRFRKRICSERELALVPRGDETFFFASRFAAKEACSKALGTGITERVRWRNIEILVDADGRPVLRLSEGALRRAVRGLCGGALRTQLSLTRQGLFASAFVLLEAEPTRA